MTDKPFVPELFMHCLGICNGRQALHGRVSISQHALLENGWIQDYAPTRMTVYLNIVQYATKTDAPRHL